MLSKILHHTHITEPKVIEKKASQSYVPSHKRTSELPENVLKPTPREKSAYRKGEKDDEEKQPLVSKELDKEAAAYKRRNPVFKEQYENLEKVVELVQEKIRNLQKEINELKKPPLQRTLTIHAPAAGSGDSVPDMAKSNEAPEHIGSKAYKNTQEEDLIEVLEQQLNDLKTQEAEIRTEMINLILEERKKYK
ncbi:hypothetical protein L1077_11240 [Pseudoalteromonas luteoviolacea]|uniref:hypothetical protein n=1 Tax=Pseudoalteromonas luteoviolacea TaxID=43657 RepID=UPI001F357E62|nr:hypothetical protein [Pseudoalteromonas luteoviolacea]MCF6440008.1 hypothetical protein [Pseudoalteromonas luteoviolacea]